jgi:hypothetical protein
MLKENKSYYEEINSKLNELSELEKQIAKIIINAAKHGYFTMDKYINKIAKALDFSSKENNSDFFRPLANIVRKLLGDYQGDVFNYIIHNKFEYPYSTDYYRRPFRTKDISCHLEGIIGKLIEIFELYIYDFSIIDYLNVADYTEDNWIIGDIIAYEIDNNNEEVINSLKEIIYGENNTALLSQTMIKGIFKSRNKDSYKMVGELLIASKLQEGLRQSIVESMDEGTLEAMIYMLKIIIENNFIRYSSVLRALDVWTGMGLESADKRVSKQCIEYAYSCLSDETIRDEYLNSNDVNKLYMSLWATAVKEEKDLYTKVIYIMENKEIYQKITAQYLLSQSQNSNLKYSIVQKYLEENDTELQYWILDNYDYNYYQLWEENFKCGNIGKYKIQIQKISSLEDKNERNRQFNIFKTIINNMSKKEISFSSKVFDWVHITYSTDIIARKMMYITAYDMDREHIGDLLNLGDLVTPDIRSELIEFFAVDINDKIQREFLFKSLSDKSMSNRESALLKIRKLDLTSDEIKSIENLLKLKTGSIRQSAINILLKLRKDDLETSIDRLLKSKNELQKSAALEIVKESKKDEEYSVRNGFGLFVESNISINEPKNYEDFNIFDVFTLSIKDIIDFLKGLSNLIHEHREYEYEVNWDSGYKDTYLLGTSLNKWNFNEFEKLPLVNVWANYFKNNTLSTKELLQIGFYFNSKELYRYYFGKLSPWERTQYKPLNNWRKRFLPEIYPMEKLEKFYEIIEQLPYNEQLETILNAYIGNIDNKKVFDLCSKILSKIIYSIPKNKDTENIMEFLSSPWIDWECDCIYDDNSFKEYFYIKYKLYKDSKFNDYKLDLEEFIKAYELNLVDKNEIFRELMTREQSDMHISNITDRRDELVKKHPSTKEFKDIVIKRILEIELERGDMPTGVSNLAISIRHFEGMDYFVKILERLSNEGFVRGYIYAFDGNITRKESLSHLLKACHPKEGENEELLRKLLNGKKILDKKLLEAAMYAPQWIEIVANYLNWEGLRSAAWYFHAHINETFSAEKETVVAHYSPISPIEFNDGAFDINWFREAYNAIGEERFNILYDCAKYISGGANHRRSQLFADAAVGKLDVYEMKNSVQDKRNKDHLLCYSLIPIENENDVLKRYEFIQKFLKESKNFGAQRRASEAKIVNIALSNLARNAGYKDVVRLTWDMESKKIKEAISYLEPKVIDDIKVQLIIDEYGSADIKITKNEKILNSIPSKYKKHEYIQELKEIKNDIKDQYVRAKKELERSMEEENSFTIEEINNIMENPVIAPLIKALVLKVDKNLGFFKAGVLEGFDEEKYIIKSNDEIVLAHPVHLYESGNWSGYQKYIFENEIKQPFKQVFRELYIPNEDELASGTISRRYAGHQVQPIKTVGLLKNRLWTVNYEEGLQKVYYKENIISKIFALADWFSPSDAECPTIETVEFFDRNTYKNIEINKIPKIIFSEIMRDLDLVVSVAHVGGVDPEASLSTIDMRKAIIRESIRLMKIENVELKGNYANINGSLGEYSVHLGSANVYKQATGALYIIPVHSGHRGKMFLPFMDEDPKTSEILSKIIMLSNDNKIKDPNILMQIKGS